MELSVVIPVFNEAEILPELARRTALAASNAVDSWEVLLVDDHSSDDTPTVELAKGVRSIRLPRNTGQYQATCAGIRQAKGDVIIVLDGDLQDPPELIPKLLAEIQDVDVVWATKSSRDEGPLFKIARAAIDLVLTLPGVLAPPAAAGSYMAMRAHIAAAASQVPDRNQNLAAVVAQLRPRSRVVHYHKAQRYDENSRIGAVGLIAEAWGTLRISGASSVLLWLLTAVLVLARRPGAKWTGLWALNETLRRRDVRRRR